MILHRLNQKVWPFIKRHQLIHPSSKVLIAVSGGADSLLLLHYFHFLSEKYNLELHVVTVDHQLRGKESMEDAQYVKEICDQLGVPCTIRSVDVTSRKQQKQESTQIAARNLRYEVCKEIMENRGFDFLAQGHHGDDQMETMLMRLTHFGRPTSFQGIPVKRSFAGGWIIRPFLCLTKNDIYHFCEQIGIMPREDPSNLSTDYERNFFRHHVLPLVKERNETAHRLVQSLVERLQEDEEFLQQESYKLMDNSVKKSKNPLSVTIDIRTFQTHAIALQRRAFHLILNYLYEKVPNEITIKHEDDFFALLSQGKSNAMLSYPGGLIVRKHYETVSFVWQESDSSLPQQRIPIPGKWKLGNGAQLKAEVVTERIQPASHQILLPDSMGPLFVRGRKKGDRIAIKGLHGHKKLNRLFIDEKVPVFKRENWPLLVDESDQILWVIGLRKAEIGIPKQTEQFILLTYQE